MSVVVLFVWTMDVDEDQQIAIGGGSDGPSHRQQSPAFLFTSPQSAEVHPVAVVRLFGAQVVHEARLPRSVATAPRCFRPASRHRAAKRAALDHPAEGLRSAAKKKPANQLLDEIVREARQVRLLKSRSQLTAIDGTGFTAQHTSHYFVRRREHGSRRVLNMQYSRFPKVGLLADCRTHFILAAVPGLGPGPDYPHLIETIREGSRRQPIGTILGDAGYDAEWVHRFIREDLKLHSIIPPWAGRQYGRPPKKPYRREMWDYFQRPKRQRCFGTRWQVETVMSMMKRRQSDVLGARQRSSQDNAVMLKILTHNLMILHPNMFSTEHFQLPIEHRRITCRSRRSRRFGQRRGSRRAGLSSPDTRIGSYWLFPAYYEKNGAQLSS
jgi:hypothetical protein